MPKHRPRISPAPILAVERDDCAVLATPGRTAGFSGGTGQEVTLTTSRTATSAVVVHATRPDYEFRHSLLRDASFAIAAIC